MKKKVIAVLGLGLFGSSLARTLAENGQEVIAIDREMEWVENLADHVAYAVQGDFSKYEVLKEGGVGSADVVVIASSKFENSIMTLLALQKLEVPQIIAKTRQAEYRKVLLKLGVDQVILPEADMGVRFANELTNGSVLDLIQLDNANQMVEFTAHGKWVGKTIDQVNFRQEYSLNLLAIKSQGQDEFKVDIDPNYQIQDKDTFIGLTNNQEVRQILKALDK